MKILVIDDGVGAFATLAKLKYALSAQYTVRILNEHFPLGNNSARQLSEVAQRELNFAKAEGYDVAVISSIALAAISKAFLGEFPAVFCCDAPILHASTYTASRVLVVGDNYTTHLTKRFPNVIGAALGEFASLAEAGASEKEIVRYIAENTEQYCGAFDCIALANSSMNLYKHCFSRVFPNVQIFDSLDGVARKLRKKYKKNAIAESSVCIFGENGENLAEKYNIFIEEFSQAY